MVERRSKLYLIGIFALLGVVASGVAYNACRASNDDDSPSQPASVPAEPVAAKADVPEPGTITAEPTRIDDVLTNPGMGLASFHFGWWCNLPPITYPPEQCADRVRKQWPENYPKSGTAYFRWHWRDLEPKRGEIDFEMIDRAIQSANQLGMTLSFRVMTVADDQSGVPDWLTSAPYNASGQWHPGDGGRIFWPDYRDATFQREHARLISALGERYNGHPAVDHVDIGTVGCWGEWNTACLSDVDSLIDAHKPVGRKGRQQVVTALTQLIDHHLSAFSETPVIMLGLGAENVGIMLHATKGGAGWRADCWGDWGLWGGSWSHQGKFYPPMIAAAIAADPGFVDVWKKAPVQLEVCGTLGRWHELGWTASKPNGKVYKSFQWALAQHASVINAKFQPVPESYVAPIDELLKRNGYRFVVDRFNHQGTVRAGSSTTFNSDWRNVGVAPAYLPRTLTYRLRGTTKSATIASTEDTRTWLPGSWKLRDTITIPLDLPKGTYQIDLALLDRDGTAPATKALPPLFLGIGGRRADGWYPISQLTVE